MTPDLSILIGFARGVLLNPRDTKVHTGARGPFSRGEQESEVPPCRVAFFEA